MCIGVGNKKTLGNPGKIQRIDPSCWFGVGCEMAMAGCHHFLEVFCLPIIGTKDKQAGKRNININVQICIVKGDSLQFCHPVALGKTFSRFRNTRFRDRSDE